MMQLGDSLHDDLCEEEGGQCSVAYFPQFEYSKKEVRRAGEVIAGSLAWTEAFAPEILRAFQVANNWRDAHAFPMRSVRSSLIWCMSRHQIDGLTAARLKRMQAIRRKLRRVRLNLEQYQDLGGCRAILDNVSDARKLIEKIRLHTRHHIRHEDDYMSFPKRDGYRGHHMILCYRGKSDDKVYDDRRIEIQIRTSLQHSWATAIEAVGLFRGEDLKANQGSAEWLRLFWLMSAEFADIEECPLPENCPPRKERVSEIREINTKLGALADLDNLGHAVQWAKFAVQPREKSKYYLLTYQRNEGLVSVSPYSSPVEATSSYGIAEAEGNRTDNENSTVVLVETDKIENLKQAFPNYFGDVQLFKDHIRFIVEGSTSSKFLVKKQEVVPQAPKEKPDSSWLRGRSRLRVPPSKPRR